jgi:hypothetical protein
VRRQAIPIPEFTKPFPEPEAAGAKNNCTDAHQKASKLGELTKETDVGVAVATIRGLLAGVTCPALIAAQIDWYLMATTMQLGSWNLHEGEELIIEIARLDDKDKKPTKVWTTVLSTGPRGRWVTTYGFAFAPSDDDAYFSKEAGQGKYRITRETNRSIAKFLPGVFFTWLPAKRELKDLSFNVGAGLGFDATNPVVYLGPSLSWNQNIAVVAGVVVRRVNRLHGRYTEDQEIAENLNPEQLVQGTYRPSAFVALTFRFGSNPFSSKPKDDKKDGKGKTDSKDGGKD